MQRWLCLEGPVRHLYMVPQRSGEPSGYPPSRAHGGACNASAYMCRHVLPNTNGETSPRQGRCCAPGSVNGVGMHIP